MAKDNVVIDDYPLMLNDAEVWGQSTPEMEALLDNVDVTLMAGHLYGERDRRNTQDGAWKATTMTWRQWMVGQAGKFGLTRHPEAKTKEGAALVFAEAIDGARKDSAIKTMFSIGLDIDSGAALDDVIEKLVELELFAIVYTSFSHGKTVIELKHDDVMRKLKLSESPNRTQVQEYLRNHHKDRYDPAFIDGIKLIDPRKQTADGLRIVVETPALDKFRVIIPLAEPVHLSDLAPTVSQWKDRWADAVCGVAVNMLGVNFDASSCDVNRLFFTPRHPVGNEDWYACVIQGKPLNFEEIVPYSKNSYIKNRDDSDPFAAGTDAPGKDDRETYLAPSGKHLNKWHSKYKERFLITDVIEAFCDDKIAVAGNEKVGTVHFECPFEHEHSKTGGTGTMSMNPLENEHGVWTIFCRHDACQGRHKLEFLSEILAQNWFEESVLEDEQWLLPDNDDDGEVIEGPGADDPLLIAATFGDMNDAEIQAHLNRWAKNGADNKMQADITATIAKNTNLTKHDVKRMWKKACSAKRQSAGKNEFPVVDLTSGYRQSCDQTYEIITDQGQDPRLFQNNGRLTTIVKDERGNIAMRTVAKDEFKSLLEQRADFQRDDTTCAAPLDIVNNVYNRPLDVWPRLDRIIAVPVFTASGDLITIPGYHEESGLYYQPKGGYEVAPVSPEPTEAEALAARDLVVDVIADFPLGGMTRAEIEHAVANGLPTPDLAHALSIPLTTLARDMIDGPTAGHLIRKDKPRTGATKIMNVLSHISTLEPLAAQLLPQREEEQEKVLISTLDEGPSTIGFDNLGATKSTRGGPLASAMTAYPQWKARRLGSTAMVLVTIKCTWVFTGIRTVMSKELADRMMLITLNPKMENPGDRPTDMFKYGDLETHVRKNAGKYLHALLTIIQYWISQGRKAWTGQALGGFESHAAVVGGILKSVGVCGFLANREVLQGSVAETNDDHRFMDALIQEHNVKLKGKPTGTLFRVFGTEDVGTVKTVGGKVNESYKRHRVVSMTAVLEREQIGLYGCYSEGPDGNISYPERAKGKIAQHIAAMVDTVREWGDGQSEKDIEHKRYILTKVGKDKTSNLYELEVHDLPKVGKDKTSNLDELEVHDLPNDV